MFSIPDIEQVSNKHTVCPRGCLFKKKVNSLLDVFCFLAWSKYHREKGLSLVCDWLKTDDYSWGK